MKFNFKIQQYQTDAVDAVVKVFQGQGYHDRISYIRDVGKKQENQQMRLNLDTEDAQQLNLYDMDDDTGYKNEVIELSDEQLLINIQKLQSRNNIKQSKALVKDLGRCSLDIEMETGTGKTYVYIKTMFELNKKYGWSKFIVVVPSIAIREGVKKSFEITADHFMEYYGKKARFFVYNSSNLNQLDNFSSSSGINVMIINTLVSFTLSVMNLVLVVRLMLSRRIDQSLFWTSRRKWAELLPRRHSRISTRCLP